jgi:hypothetical protein
VAVIVGPLYTVIIVVAELLQAAEVPVKVYVVVMVGETVTFAPVRDPGIHV